MCACVCVCLCVDLSDENYDALHQSSKGEEDKADRRRGGKTTVHRPADCQVPEGSLEQRKMEETGWEVICGAPMTFAV